MARFTIVLVCILLAAVCSAAPEVEKLQASVEFVDDISAYRAENPDVELVPLEAVVQPFGQKRYTLGKRVVDDRLVAQYANNFTYPSPKDVRLTLDYPKSGVGAVISYVQIDVEQTNNSGDAYFSSGGVGLRHIRLIVKAFSTKSFAYRAAIFGSD